MNKILISTILIISLMVCASSLDLSGLEMQPREAAAEELFNKGIGQAWAGGDSQSFGMFDTLFSQYYSVSKGSSLKKHIDMPKKHEMTGEMPTTVYFSYQMQAVPYDQYKTYSTYTGGNSLWIQGPNSWTQYAQVPQGSSLSLLATSSAGGNGYLYEIGPNGTLSKNSFYFYPGNSQMNFNANAVGQHILLFIIGAQVSNSVVIDVIPYTTPQTSSYPPAGQNPVPIQSNPQSYPQGYPQGYPQSYPQGYPQGTIQPPGSTPISTMGDTSATIVSQGMQGYQVFLDGNYIGTEGTGGDPRDGKFNFKVIGNQNHDVRVYDGQFNYPKTMYFQRGVQKIINVEPGTAVYN